MGKRWLVGIVCGMGLGAAHAAAAKLDCPLRDAPFSVDGPLVDLLLSERAKTVVERHAPGAIARINPFLTRTQAPTFGSIVTLRAVSGFETPALVPDPAALEANLRSLPITAADREARCARYDDERPQVKVPAAKPRVLLFGKMTGFRDDPSVEAAHAAFVDMARRKGWSLMSSDKGGAMHPSVLRNFDVVVWNNVSGDVLTLSQRRAFRRYVENGGGFVAVHGSAGDPVYFWDWYRNTLIGAQFIGHPSDPQFQDAQIRLEPNATGIGTGLTVAWSMRDEWYSFEKSPRLTGATVIATLDETSYRPGQGPFNGPALAMGADHPIAWARCPGKGRAFYSAIGHRPETYSEATHVKLLEQAVDWAADRTRGCGK